MQTQTIVAAAIVLLAAIFIGRRAYAAMRPSRSDKGGCSGCSSGGGHPTNTPGDWSKM